MKLFPYFLPWKKLNSEHIKDLNIRPDTYSFSSSKVELEHIISNKVTQSQ